MKSSHYLEKERRDYALYVIRSRALPAVTDGLKAAGRRTLWIARDGKKWKTATLAGATMPIHPHAAPEDPIATLAAPYNNNIPLFESDCAFGTLLEPTAYGSARYTYVALSKFAKDVVFRDIEIVPMMDNYDDTEQEPKHFLPLVPIVLLNPISGIAIGFAADILPRPLDKIIDAQIRVLKKQPIEDILPAFNPIHNESFACEKTEKKSVYHFQGEFERKNSTTIQITKLPYGQSHAAVISKLDAEYEYGSIVDFTDRSSSSIDIEIKFKRGILDTLEDSDILNRFGLYTKFSENLNVLDFTGETVWSTNCVDLITKFTNWRLLWYVKRYERLRDLLKIDLQRYLDIKTAIEKNVGSVARKTPSRSALKEYLEKIGIVYVDYIADLPVYRFTEEEKTKNEQKIAEALKTLAEYEDLLSSEEKRRKLYIAELQEILAKYKKGQY